MRTIHSLVDELWNLKTGEGGKMAEEGKTYVCDVCGQEVKVTKSGVGTLVCCDVPMHVKSD